MACAGCDINLKDGTPIGCRNNGNCSTGGCNRLNTYDWLTALDIEDVEPFFVVEVSFKNGSRKGFFFNQPYTRATTGDLVVVETNGGFDIGRITLSGELVRTQMRKKRVPEDGYFPKVLRKANEKDLKNLEEARGREKEVMVRARVIARSLKLNMKIGDVEFQSDGRKATFFYTADGRVDFRELIKHFAKEFRVKIEMRQIGARQESARIGGLGPCGRELCCSTWLTSYRTVSTAAARYQNLAINQAKLSGQCGRLKCCLNYELDTYMEALSSFPEDAEKLQTKQGVAVLVKTDIFKGLMYYTYEKGVSRGRLYTLDLEKVRSVREMNKRGERPEDLAELHVELTPVPEEPEHDFEDVTGVIELPPEERKGRRNKRRNKNRGGNNTRRGNANNNKSEAQEQKVAPPSKKEKGDDNSNNRNNNNRKNRGRGRGGNRNRNRDNGNTDKKA